MILDTQQWRVYAAEHSIAPGAQFECLEHVQARIDQVVGAQAWMDMFPHMRTVTASLTDEAADDDSLITSWGGPIGSWLADRGTITLHVLMMNEAVMLHELAHCASPPWSGQPAAIRKGRAVMRPNHGHSEFFTASLSYLFEAFGTDVTHQDLGDAYAHFKVPMATRPALRTAVENSRAVEQASTDDENDPQRKIEREQAEQYFRERTGKPVPSGPGVIPESRWGDAFMISRGRQPRGPGSRSLKDVAAAISRAQKCTPADIKTIEGLPEMPVDDKRLRQLALLLGAFYGIDPVWLRTAKGLARWESGVHMQQLQMDDSSWVRNVRHLNRMSRERPPYTGQVPYLPE